MRGVAVVFALVTGGAVAEELLQPEAAVLPRVIASLCIDIHSLTGCETAFLLRSETEPGTADLVILGDRRNAGGGAPLAVARSLVFSGAMWGMAPGLEAGPDGLLTITSEQLGAGRNAWMH